MSTLSSAPTRFNRSPAPTARLAARSSAVLTCPIGPLIAVTIRNGGFKATSRFIGVAASLS